MAQREGERGREREREAQNLPRLDVSKNFKETSIIALFHLND
jgi:hypothetical protein